MPSVARGGGTTKLDVDMGVDVGQPIDSIHGGRD